MRTAVMLVVAVVTTAPVLAQTQIAACAYQDIACSSHPSGRLENATCHFTDTGDPYFVYRIVGTSGKLIDVFMTTTVFRPALAIYRGSNNYPEKFKAGSCFGGSCIVSLQYDIQSSDTYWLTASSGDESRSGLFLLDFYCSFTCVKPSILTPFQSMTLSYGAVTTLSVNVDGTPPFRYRWFDADSPNVTLGTGAMFTTPPVTKTTAFHVLVSNDCGQGDFYAALVKVEVCNAPTITSQPQPKTVPRGGSVTLAVAAAGEQPFAYQWFEEWPPGTVVGVGANSPTLVIPSVDSSRQFWVRVSNKCGGVNSEHVTVTVQGQSKRRAAKH